MTQRPILVVEDDENLALLIAQLLRREGYVCTVLRNGAQACALARRLQPALLLLDFMMPAGGGAAVHRELRQAEDTRALPVLIVTAAPEEHVHRAIDMDGRTYYLAKPYARAELLELVKRILEDVD
ncbi:MAG: response regulator transcription factor [Elusimicrobia bacterium]|nr:response regulator transcription factor [Elusimicrobiota bacterium]